MGRPKAEETMETVSARLPRGMLSQIDAYLKTMREEMPLLLLNRADAVRQLLALGLETSQRKRKPPKK